MNNGQVQNFIDYWVQEKKMAEMRVAFIYGYYAEDPFYKNGIRAISEALYEPEQKCTATKFEIKDS
jgi:nuclear protein localization family protein 4